MKFQLLQKIYRNYLHSSVTVQRINSFHFLWPCQLLASSEKPLAPVQRETENNLPTYTMPLTEPSERVTKHNSFAICPDYMTSVSTKHSDCKALNWNFSYSVQHSTWHSLSSRGMEGSKHEPSLGRARKERRDPENYRPVKKMPKPGKLIQAINKE